MTENESGSRDSRESHESREVFDESTGTWMPVVPEESPEVETHEHGGDQVEHVMMVMAEDEKPPIAERLSSLAQRLQALRSEIDQPKHELSFQAMLPCDSSGSTSPRMALQ